MVEVETSEQTDTNTNTNMKSLPGNLLIDITPSLNRTSEKPRKLRIRRGTAVVRAGDGVAYPPQQDQIEMVEDVMESHSGEGWKIATDKTKMLSRQSEWIAVEFMKFFKPVKAGATWEWENVGGLMWPIDIMSDIQTQALVDSGMVKLAAAINRTFASIVVNALANEESPEQSERMIELRKLVKELFTGNHEENGRVARERLDNL